ncbi:hypothetical protein ACS0TY_013437 [Phlomoides rotata]
MVDERGDSRYGNELKCVSSTHVPPTASTGGVNDQIEGLEKEVDTMRKQMLDRVSNPRPITGCQFSDVILHDELPYNFKPLNYEYDGIADPYDHLARFENSALQHRYWESVKCTTFLTMHSQAAQQWFGQLGPSGSFERICLQEQAKPLRALEKRTWREVGRQEKESPTQC